MKKQAIILHGWPQKLDKHWYGWLKRELESKGLKVLLPELPTMLTSGPDMSKQLDHVENLIGQNSETILIGHSLGALLSLRLAERNKVHTIICIAGFDFDDLTEGLESFWLNKINHQKVIKNTKKRFIVHSDNDPYVTERIAREMSKRLKSKFIFVPKAGHFMQNDNYEEIPQVLDLL